MAIGGPNLGFANDDVIDLESSLTELVEGLAHPSLSWEERMTIRELIGNFGPKAKNAVPPLINYLSQYPDLARAAVWVLADIQDERSVGPLLMAMERKWGEAYFLMHDVPSAISKFSKDKHSILPLLNFEDGNHDILGLIQLWKEGDPNIKKAIEVVLSHGLETTLKTSAFIKERIAEDITDIDTIFNVYYPILEQVDPRSIPWLLNTVNWTYRYSLWLLGGGTLLGLFVLYLKNIDTYKFQLLVLKKSSVPSTIIRAIDFLSEYSTDELRKALVDKMMDLDEGVRNKVYEQLMFYNNEGVIRTIKYSTLTEKNEILETMAKIKKQSPDEYNGTFIFRYFEEAFQIVKKGKNFKLIFVPEEIREHPKSGYYVDIVGEYQWTDSVTEYSTQEWVNVEPWTQVIPAHIVVEEDSSAAAASSSSSSLSLISTVDEKSGDNENVGGVDMNDISVDRSGYTTEMNLDSKMFTLKPNIDVEGFRATIIEIIPISNLFSIIQSK